MSQTILALLAALGGITVGTGAGFMIRKSLTSKRILKLEQEQKKLLLEAKEEAFKLRGQADKDLVKKRELIEQLEEKVRSREQAIDRRQEALDNQRKDLALESKQAERLKEDLKNQNNLVQKELEKVAKLKKEGARKLLLEQIERENSDELKNQINKFKEALKLDQEKIARQIIATALGRIATEHTAESTSYTIQLPSEDMKGRIIGKEGRNIQHFEKLTGVDVTIDSESSESVTISSFDPVRRQIAKVAMERLVADGRIQQSRIEEVIEKAQKDVGKETQEAGDQAALELGITGLHPDLTKILGSLKFRTSFGQNQLKHAQEVATIAGLLASEIKADVNIAKKAGLLHDIGKAIDHDVPGAHHHISMEIAKKYGLSEVVVNAIGAHHDDIEPKTVEAILVRVADAISGARPGARRESLENYINRMTELENVAKSFPGVDKVFAIQAGREVRILVKPEEISDLESIKLAKDIARKIENELQYPGMIKINVIRETRTTELAK